QRPEAAGDDHHRGAAAQSGGAPGPARALQLGLRPVARAAADGRMGARALSPAFPDREQLPVAGGGARSHQQPRGGGAAVVRGVGVVAGQRLVAGAPTSPRYARLGRGSRSVLGQSAAGGTDLPAVGLASARTGPIDAPTIDFQRTTRSRSIGNYCYTVV